MPHFPKPFWRADRQRWMLQLHPGEVLTLGAERDEAFRRYYEIMAAGSTPPAQQPVVVRTTDDPTVAELPDQFLDWVSRNRKPRTYQTYRERLQLFLSALDDPHLTVAKLKPYHVTRFVDKHSNWSAAIRRGRMIVVQTALN